MIERPFEIPENVFNLWYNEPPIATLYVPAGTKEVYEATEGWNKLKNIVEMEGGNLTIPDEAIDLGLPSGTKWAPWNVGASKPEEFGGYYAWGETEEKDVYDWSTYKWCNGSDDSQTKYCTNSDYGTVDNKTTLDLEDDVAHVKWGGPWKMPTLDQVQELLDNCTSEWTTQNGVEGRKFTGPNGNSIFLPAAGCRWDGELYNAGSYGFYWSSALCEGYPNSAYELDFISGGAYWDGYYRSNGLSVRPVYVESSTIEIPTDGLVAYYPFNGNANDESGHGNNGTPMDNVTLTMGVHGDANGAYQFGGTDNPGHIHIPNSESLVINDGWSFATYIKPTSYNGMNGWGEPAQYGGHAIMGKSHDQHGFSIYYDITEETLRTKIGHWGDEWEADATVSGKFLNHWTHIAYTYSSNSGFCVYINGEMVCRSDKTPDFSVANTQDYYLGKYDDFWYPMNGVMDEVCIYNRALTADEVMQMAQYAEDSTNETIPTEAIDLGLPSGTKWAPWNVGASKPEDYGGYYAWGETEERSVYSYESYMYYDASSDTYIDIGSEISGTQYDVAHVKWGGEWQMPTKDQIQELLDNCSSEWTTMNGVNGRKFTGSNGNSIFLPATGSCWTDGVDNAGICSWYWSGTLTPWGGYDWLAYDLSFDNDHPRLAYDGIRASGCPVRPVFASSGNTDVEPYAVLSDDGKTVTFYYDDQKASRGGIDINNREIYSWEGEESPYGTATTAVFDASFADYRPVSTACWFMGCSSLTTITGIENLNTSNVTNMSWMFGSCSGLTSLDVSGFNTSNVTSMSGIFYECSGLTSLDVSGFDTSNVTDMYYMFYGCSGLTSLDVSGFDTSNVTYMWGMFAYCSGLTSLDVSGFNTSNVEGMDYMFYGCSGLTSLDVSGFDTSNVTSMSGIFYECSGLTSLDVSGFNTSNVEGMDDMFYGCSGLTSLDVSGFDTSNVTYMWGMFAYCSGLTSLDVSGFNTSNVEVMDGMFYDCSELTTIYADEAKWNTANVTSSYDMFSGCNSLVGGNGTEFDTNHTDAEYARIDKPGQPGYFTEKNAEQMDIEPIDQGETVDFSEEIDDNTDLDGNVVGDIYYNISAGDGSYNAAEGCIVVTTPTDDSVIDGQDIFGEDFQTGFTGIVFKVPAGKGTVKVEAQTFGAMVLKVKIGDNDPIEMELEGRLKVSFPYNVTEPTYVYIYGGTTSQSGVRRAANEPSSLKIYGIECTTTSVNGDADGDGTIDVNDITCVAAHILGRNPANFNAAAADADGDGTIDVNDITVIAGMILNAGK